MSGPPLTCRFEHPGIAGLGAMLFRLTKGDGVAALVMSLDRTDVVVPLQAVASLFEIMPDSPDGQMVGLIEKSLQFVSTLRIGDPLPNEVLTGEASWQPGERHMRIATGRLQHLLVNWISGSSAAPVRHGPRTSTSLLVLMDDPAFRPKVQEALRRAASELGVEGGEAVAKLIEGVAVELSYIEALRERLLERAQATVKRLGRMNGQRGTSASRRETLQQVLRLSTTGLAKITSKFEEIDAMTSEIVPILRNLEGQRSFLRPHRDWLYCTFLGWEAILGMADPRSGSMVGDAAWKSIEDAYRFLAPRYMSVQQWQGASATVERVEQAKAVLVW